MGASDFSNLPHIGEALRRKEDYRFLTGAGNYTDGTPMKEPMHPILAINKVRYVGDHVAMVVAETVEQAKNAAEAVVVDYDVHPALVSVADAAKKQSGVTLHDEAPDNQCYKWAIGDKAAVDAAFANAAHVTRL